MATLQGLAGADGCGDVAAGEADEVDGLMAELDGLSDEDALALLAAEEEGGLA